MDNKLTRRKLDQLFGWAELHLRLSHWKGVAVALMVAATATFLSEHYGAPTMLFALLIGLSLSFLAEVPALEGGLNFTAKTVLRLGVGLLGIRLGFEDVQAIGGTSIAAVFGMVLATLLCGLVLSYAIGRKVAFGILSGGAVAVCGASAALAFSSVLPDREDREKDTVLVVISVTVLSTMAMVLYPILFQYLGYDDLQTGFLIGATIHDVAQVVGAGYSVSDDAGLTATLVKMLRVAALPVLVLAIHLMFHDSQSKKSPFPWFLILFVALAVLRSVVDVPEQIIRVVSEAARWMMVAAIAAIGLRTDLGSVLRVHPSLMVILVLETLFLLGLALLFTDYFLN
ncbi:putative sulfate exporter family transporter [Yoonia sp. BS5-3]|uniref:YeiH family protein n=1 Tax=Yoonia phaeophyticola TaxID=3137369 RepID=A0ABZ2V7E9_9RHOB